MADLFDIVTARKLSGGGGGGATVEALSVTQNGTYTAPSGKAYSPVTVNVSGGSSDFSTAEVTITTGSSKTGVLNIPIVYDDGEYANTACDTNNTVGEKLYVIPLYKGEATINMAGDATIVTTGGVEYYAEDYYLLITGDGTITVS